MRFRVVDNGFTYERARRLTLESAEGAGTPWEVHGAYSRRELLQLKRTIERALEKEHAR